jgi:hypothetical protein
VPDEWDFYNLINTDRPDFTDATYSVGRGVSIIETGYTFRKAFDHQENAEQSRRSLPEALVRYGLTDEFEVRLKWNGYVMSDLHDFNTGLRTQLFGGDDLITSIKYEVWQQDGALPMLTFLTGTTVPTGTNGACRCGGRVIRHTRGTISESCRSGPKKRQTETGVRLAQLL